MRVDDNMLAELIRNDGATIVGEVAPMGVLRLALDLRDARQEIKRLSRILEAKKVKK